MLTPLPEVTCFKLPFTRTRSLEPRRRRPTAHSTNPSSLVAVFCKRKVKASPLKQQIPASESYASEPLGIKLFEPCPPDFEVP